MLTFYGLIFQKINSIQFEETTIESGLIFHKLSTARVSYDSFKLVYFANLTEYFEIRNIVERGLDSIKHMCILYSVGICNIKTAAINRQLEYMKQHELEINLFRSTNQTTSRPKRAIEFIGKFFSWAFGLVDAEQAREYDKQIDNLKTDTDTLFNIEAKGLLFMKQNMLTNRDTFNFLFEYTKNITKYTNFEQHRINEKMREIYVLDLYDLLNLWINEHHHLSQQILKHLEGAIYGKISQLIPTDIFKGDLEKIEKTKMSEHQRLPIDIFRDNILNMYKYCITRASIYNNTLLIEINIPSIDNDLYTIYKITPIPIISDGIPRIIIPNMEYVLFNEHNTGFIPLTEQEYENGMINSENEKIIKPYDNLHHDHKDNCEMSLFLNPSQELFSKLCTIKTIPITNYFIPLLSCNQYYLTTFEPINLLEFCKGKSVQRKLIEKPGILTLSENCRIRTDKITLRPRTTTIINSKEKITIADELRNISINQYIGSVQNTTELKLLRLEEPSVLISNHIKDFDDLANKADEIIEQVMVEQKFKHASEETKHQQLLMIFCIVTIPIILIALAGLFLFLKARNIDTWINIMSRIPDKKMFVQKVFPRTPKAGNSLVDIYEEVQIRNP